MNKWDEFVHIIKRSDNVHVRVVEHDLPSWLELALRTAAREAGPGKTPMILLRPRNKPWSQGFAITMQSLSALATEWVAALEAQDPATVAEIRAELDNESSASE